MGFFYTGKGDWGKSFIGKKPTSKTHPVMDALGDLDELNSLLGLVLNKTTGRQSKKILGDIQEVLFIIQAQVAYTQFGGKFQPPKLSRNKIAELEKLIDAFERKLKPERGFVVAGANETSAWLDYARTVSRRAERSVLKFGKNKKFGVDILAYLNRLSSLLFALARLSAKNSGKKERHPNYK